MIQESLISGRGGALAPDGILLYDWWPIRAEARLLDRLAEMDVRVLDAGGPVPRGVATAGRVTGGAYFTGFAAGST